MDTAQLKRRRVGIKDESEEEIVVMEEEQETTVVKVASVRSESTIDWTDLVGVILLTAAAIFTRMWRIGRSDIVTWDEAHFGKFGSHYLKREFYFDVHPPLGKMLVGLSGLMAGYNGSFEFESGNHYPPELNYVFMRLFNATFATLCVPLAYYTARQLRLPRPAVWLVSLAVLCENSYATLGRFILLDSMLLFFTMSTTAGLATLHRLRFREFSPEWWAWLFVTGVSIGCVCSVKWVGMLATALVGLYTVEDLWHKFGDLNMPVRTYITHWAARIVGLIMVPVAVYMGTFYVHFAILRNSGPGDAQMSSLFQANLHGSDLLTSPLELHLGSRATIKNMGYGGGLLHSHVQLFPEGSGQQQVTCYHHKDVNNDWFFYPTRTEGGDVDPSQQDLRPITDGMEVRFIHAQTGRNLHSHTVGAPITKSDWEVSCYGNLTIGDDKDHWRVEILNDAKSRDHSRLRTLTTAFRLRHTVLGCYLKANNVNLPQWGFKQIEVTCDKKNDPRDIHTHWNVESHWNERLPPGNAQAYSSPFLRDFVHLNVAMMTSNNALVPDPDKQDDLASQAWQWPIGYVGLRMCGWDATTIKYYLLGNPANVWVSTAAVLFFAGRVFVWLVRWQRQYPSMSKEQLDLLHYAGVYPALGYCLHYLPFFLMGRVLYVHHYMPALYFAILVLGYVVGEIGLHLPSTVRMGMYALLYGLVVGVFALFRDISFGMEGDALQYAHLKWLPSWRLAD